METTNFQDNWGGCFSGGFSLNYTDKDNFIYETGLYLNNRNMKIDHYSQINSYIDGIIYHINDINMPITMGVRINKGVFSKFNIILQGGMFISYGVNGKGSIYYNTPTNGDWHDVKKIFFKQNYSIGSQPLEYYPIKRLDSGTIFKLGLNYKNFDIYINSETGFVNLNRQYGKYIKSDKFYLSINYHLLKNK